MSNIQTVKAQIQTLINSANATTGNADTNLTDGVNALISGYGQGGSEPTLQDKTITENGTYSADSGYDGLGTVTVEVESGLTGLENGYDVMFYDEDNVVLAFNSIRQGSSMNAPDYVVKAWETEDGTVIQFPYTPTSDLVLYANNNTLASTLYNHYGIDMNEYPYLIIYKHYEAQRIYIYFLESIDTETENSFGTNGKYASANKYVGAVQSNEKEELIELIIEKITSLDYGIALSAGTTEDTYNAAYTNYDSVMTAVAGRLDE